MTNKKKFVYITTIASPHQVAFCNSLQEYFNSEFLFYDYIGNRPNWWKVDIGNKCTVLPYVLFKKKSKYLTISHILFLRKFNPDIVMLGGFSIPANYLAYLWSILNKKRVIVFTERSRDKHGRLRERGFIWRIIKLFYRRVDLVIVSAEDAIKQFKEDFHFNEKVKYCNYASDIDNYFSHKLREHKQKNNYIYLFPNRLIDIYNPLLAIHIFKAIVNKYPGSVLKINAEGPLKNDCIKLISELDIIGNVIFLTEIKQWDDLPIIYKSCDIMILPALFSNGNFTIIEAMASGMGIVISNKILGIGNLIVDGVNGYNCEPNIAEFVKRIEEYINNPSLFVSHAKLNREKAFPFSAKGTAKKFYEILNSK